MTKLGTLLPLPEALRSSGADSGERSSTVERIRAEIESAILKGELAGGEKLTEAALSRWLGVSRGPLREALGQLQSDGYVIISRNRGAFVRALDRADISDIFEVREILEARASARCAQRASEPDIRQAFTALLEECDAYCAGKAARPFVEHDRDFHEAIVAWCGNSQLLDHWKRLQMPVFRLRFFATSEMLDTAALAHEHRTLIRYILEGNAKSARATAARHIRVVSEMIQQLTDDEFKFVFQFRRANQPTAS